MFGISIPILIVVVGEQRRLMQRGMSRSIACSSRSLSCFFNLEIVDGTLSVDQSAFQLLTPVLILLQTLMDLLASVQQLLDLPLDVAEFLEGPHERLRLLFELAIEIEHATASLFNLFAEATPPLGPFARHCCVVSKARSRGDSRRHRQEAKG
jgi:hypothetical protein